MKRENFQLIYLGISLFSTFCVTADCYLVECSNLVGLMCLVDFWFVKKKDMLFHHVCVLLMLHYMNAHPDITNRHQIISTILSTEISTIFLVRAKC